MKSKITAFLLAALMLFSPLGVQAAPAGEALISQMQALKAAPANENERALAETLEKSLSSYQGVRDYKAVFVKQEKSEGKLGPIEKIYLKFEKPFKIYLHWLNTQKKGLQVLYNRGHNGNKLAIHKPGLLFGLAPVVFLDQSSPWVRQGSESFDIEDAGIGTFLNAFSESVVKGAKEKKLEVKPLAAGQFEVTFPGTSEKEAGYFAHRIIVRFDAQTGLPTYMELYDWHDAPIGIYSYQNVRLNLGPSDKEFRKLIDGHLYNVYKKS